MSSPLQDLNTLQQELRALVYDQLQLAALEVRLASLRLMAMVAAAVCIGALLLLVWAGLMAVLALGLVRMKFDLLAVLLVITMLTSGLALLLSACIRRWSGRMGLPATLHALKPAAAELQAGNETRDLTT